MEALTVRFRPGGCVVTERRFKFPDWVNREIDSPAEEGGRNQQCIKIGPTILRCGATSDELEGIFERMHPELDDTEIGALVGQSVKYCKTALPQPESVDLVRRRMLFQAAKAALPSIRKKPRNVPPPLDLPLREQRRLFLRTLFEPEDLLWIGEKHEKAFLLQREWLAGRIPGGFICPNAFMPESSARTNANVATRKYMVVESDILTMPESLAVFAVLETEHHLNPRALVFSGKKSLHAWFDWPFGADPEDWKAVLQGYGCDPATVTASQPVRLPGIVRPDTGKPQNLLLLG
jgi:hypothetical protein